MTNEQKVKLWLFSDQDRRHRGVITRMLVQYGVSIEELEKLLNKTVVSHGQNWILCFEDVEKILHVYKEDRKMRLSRSLFIKNDMQF